MQQALKDVMRAYPQGVTVVTARDELGLTGITVSSFISVSLDPPLILVSIAKSTGRHESLRDAKEFAVNFLAEDQKSVSDRFAGRVELRDRFEGLAYRFETTSSPIIGGVCAFIECRAWRVHDEGDHFLLLGEIVNARKLSDKSPLVYQNQQYTTIVRSDYPAPPSDIVW
jgi:flavin reductase (DIM6/NTAB) family NADH-FMN oxidoreductase RutF